MSFKSPASNAPAFVRDRRRKPCGYGLVAALGHASGVVLNLVEVAGKASEHQAVLQDRQHLTANNGMKCKESGNILLRNTYIRKQAIGLFFHHGVALAGSLLESQAINYGYAAPPVLD